MPDPHPDQPPFVVPLGFEPRVSKGGVPQLIVTEPPSAGAGTVVVSSDALLAQVGALGTLGTELHHSAAQLRDLIDRWPRQVSLASQPLVADAHRAMEDAWASLGGAALHADRIHDGIVRSLAKYSITERVATGILHVIDQQAAWGLGAAMRVLVGPLIGNLALDQAVAKLMSGASPSQAGSDAQAFFKRHGRILTNPVTVAAIRETASDVGAFDAGFASIFGYTFPIAEATGVTGVRSAAAQVAAEGEAFGLFEETPVVVRQTSSYEFPTPPTSLFDRATSFPNTHTDAHGEQIRIDRYVEEGQPYRFDVYISGTVTFDPVTTTEPFDATSDLRGVAGLPTASTSAVEQAMAKAGITSTSPVVLNGYSQGGLIASTIAATGKYNVHGVVTFGAPSGQVKLPASIPVLSVRNTEDLVPATSGYDVNPNAVIVTRSLFAHSAVPATKVVPAHELGYYQQTAAVIDTADSAPVRSMLDKLDSFGAGASTVQSSLWLATRTDGSVWTPPLVPTPSTTLPAREAVAE